MTRYPALIGMAALAVVLLVVLLTGGPVAPGSARAQEILAAVWSPDERTPYVAEGETAVRFRGEWLHSGIRVLADGRRERYEYTTGPAAKSVVCCEGDRRWQRTADGTVVAYPIGADATPSTASQLDRIARNYRFVFSGRDRVAGRRAQVVTIIARDTHRRVRRLWVDAERSIILAMVQYDARGRPVASTRYSQIEFRPGLIVALPTPGPGEEGQAAVERRADSRARLGFTPAAPRYLPAGYRPVGAPAILECPCGCAGVTEVRRYDDGLRSFSLFQTSADHKCCALDDACRHGRECGDRCHATRYGPGTIVARRIGSVAAIAVGDPGVDQLRRVVESL